jgi:hypothetical protein
MKHFETPEIFYVQVDESGNKTRTLSNNDKKIKRTGGGPALLGASYDFNFALEQINELTNRINSDFPEISLKQHHKTQNRALRSRKRTKIEQ